MKFYLVNIAEYLREGRVKTYQYDKYNLSQLIKKNINQLKLSCQIEDGTEYILSVQYSDLPKSETIKLMDDSNKLQWAEINIEINKESLKVSIIDLASIIVGMSKDIIIQLSFEIDDTSFLSDMNKVAEYTLSTDFVQEFPMSSAILTRLPGGVFHIFSGVSHQRFLYDGKAEKYTIGSYVFNFSTQTIQCLTVFSFGNITIYYDETNIPYVTSSLVLNHNGEAKLSYTQSSSFTNDVHYSYQLFDLQDVVEEVASATTEKTDYDFSEIFDFTDNTKYQAQVSFTYQYKDYENNIYDYTVVTISNELIYYTPPTVTLKASLDFNGKITVSYQVTGPTINKITTRKCSYVIYRIMCDNKIEKYSGSMTVTSTRDNFILAPSGVVLQKGEYYQVKITLQYYWSSSVGSVESSQTTLSSETLWEADNSFNTLMTNIASAIREKTGYTSDMTIKNMIEVLNNYESQTGYYDDSEYDDTSIDSCLKKLAKIIRVKLIGPALVLPLTLMEMPEAIKAINPSDYEGCDSCDSYIMTPPDCESCENNDDCLVCDSLCDGCQDCQTNCETSCQGCEDGEECTEECGEECTEECTEECGEECTEECTEECGEECTEECTEECGEECTEECTEECGEECTEECGECGECYECGECGECYEDCYECYECGECGCESTECGCESSECGCESTECYESSCTEECEYCEGEGCGSCEGEGCGTCLNID